MARFCTECGKEIADGMAFCTECGAGASPQVCPQPVPLAAAASELISDKGKYEPISTGGYIGIMLLMCIPVIGQILTIVWACGGCRKVNKRNFARAMLVFLIISIVLCGILYFTGRMLWMDILQSSDMGGLMNEADELSDMLKQLEELNNMIPTQ